MSLVVESIELAWSLKWDIIDSLVLGSSRNRNQRARAQEYTDGSGADKASKFFVGQYSIAALGNQQLDLAGGLTDYFGASITFTKIREILIELDATSTASELVIGGGTDGAGTNAFAGFLGDASHKVRCGNGSFFHAGRPDATGFAVTAGTGDILRIENADGANAAAVNVFLVGE
jgi:hypothetical protein